MDIELVDVAPRWIVYLERTTPSAPEEIGAAMQECYEALFSLLSEQRVTPLGAPLAIYDTFGPEQTTFRAAFPVAEEDCRRMSESAMCGETPGGATLRAVHRGPYTSLATTYREIGREIEEKGLVAAGPSWEVYLSDGDGTPEAPPETEIFMPVAKRP